MIIAFKDIVISDLYLAELRDNQLVCASIHELSILLHSSFISTRRFPMQGLLSNLRWIVNNSVWLLEDHLIGRSPGSKAGFMAVRWENTEENIERGRA